MAITKANFYQHSLNQFVPNRVRGEYLDWGLNALVLEAQIDASETGTLYAGDPVKIKSTSTGKLKVVAGATTDAFVGYILYNPKHETVKAGDIVSILIDGGVISEVTEDAVSAGATLYYKDSDGSVTTTQPTNAVAMGIALSAVSATSGGTLIPVLVRR